MEQTPAYLQISSLQTWEEMTSVLTLGSRVLARLAGDLQGRVVLQSTAGILLGLWFLLKTKFQVGTGMALGPL